MFAHILPRSETRINVPPCTVTNASPSHVLCFLFCGFLLVTGTVNFVNMTGSNSITFLWETEAAGGAGGRTVGGFSATGFSGVNCLEREAEFVKGGNCASTKSLRPKQAPERYSEACMARSISSSLLPRLNWEPSSSALELTLPVVRLKN